MIAYREILYHVADRCATITLNRPDRLNAWTPVMESEVRHALERAEADRAVGVVVITGAGRAFCAGADLGDVKDITASPFREGADRFDFLRHCEKAIVAAINGPAAGVGLSITLYCDFRYMAEGTKITAAFARLGLVAEHGAAWLLPRLIGIQDALDILYSGRAVGTAEAASMGLVRGLPSEDFLDAVQERARLLVAKSSPRSIAVMKRQVAAAASGGLDEALAVSVREQQESTRSADAREGVAAFREKRSPQFTGE